jgi:hypothetical protein
MESKMTYFDVYFFFLLLEFLSINEFINYIYAISVYYY